MRQFCLSPSSIGRRCLSEEQVWLNGRNRLNSTTHPACLPSFFFPSLLPLWESLGDSVTLYRMHARIFFCSSNFSPAGSKDDRDRRVRSTGDPSDDGQVLLDYISSLGRSGPLRDACIQKKSAISSTSRGNRFSMSKKKKQLSIVLHYHARSNNFLLRSAVSRLPGLFDVSNCIAARGRSFPATSCRVKSLRVCATIISYTRSEI